MGGVGGEIGWGRGGFEGGDLLLLVGLLGGSELIFELHAELVGGAAELAHELAELTGEFGEFFGAKEEQRDEEDDGAVLEAHRASMIRGVGRVDKCCVDVGHGTSE